jgi:hypothetical protein
MEREGHMRKNDGPQNRQYKGAKDDRDLIEQNQQDDEEAESKHLTLVHSGCP